MPSRLRLILSHACRKDRALLWSVFFALLLAALFFRLTGLEWWAWGGAITTLATLAVGVIIWFTEAAEDWEQALPKRLTVEFFFAPPNQPPRLAMTCLKAPLTGESDIRTWGIALGAQMDGGKRQLKYRPYFATLPPEVVPDDDGHPCRHYTIRFTLEELPERLAQLEAEKKRPLCLQWSLEKGCHREDILPADAPGTLPAL